MIIESNTQWAAVANKCRRKSIQFQCWQSVYHRVGAGHGCEFPKILDAFIKKGFTDHILCKAFKIVVPRARIELARG